MCALLGCGGLALSITAAASVVRADDLAVHEPTENGGPIEVTYRLGSPLPMHGWLEAEWTDVIGRVIERRRIPLADNSPQVQLYFDSSRAVTARNHVSVCISLAADTDGELMRCQGKISTSFTVPLANNSWFDYQVIIWQQQTLSSYRALKELGVTAGAVLSDRRDSPGSAVFNQIETILDGGLGWYLENTATDFYSVYHKWSVDRPINWNFLEAKRRYRTSPTDPEATYRNPSLSDSAWLEKIAMRLNNNVRKLRRYGPLFYNLADEPGIADLSAFWDFDLSAPSLAAMRDWLKTRYSDLKRLNDEWGSDFANWDDVVPMTTPEALKRKDQNFAGWSDFKEWMDIAFASALKHGSEAVHAADPRAMTAIEGAQAPGWGGYDYRRLAGAVDAMEVDTDGDADDLLRTFNPNAVTMTTSFDGASEVHRLWRALLRGSRGVIVWDSKHQIVDEQGNIGKRGREIGAVFREIRSGLGALLSHSRKHTDPIAILYSPESMRTQWLLDRIKSGDDWTRRSAESELQDHTIRVSQRNFVNALRRMGLHPDFLGMEQLQSDGLVGYRLLILPGSIALSREAAEAIRTFTAAGGTVLADGEPGLFDEHARKLKRPLLSDLFSAASTPDRNPSRGGRVSPFAAPRPYDRNAAARLRSVIASAGIEPVVLLSCDDGQPSDDVEMFISENGDARIVALLRDADRDAATGRCKRTVTLRLREPYAVYDVRGQRQLGIVSQLNVQVGPTDPVVVVLTRQTLAPWRIVGPKNVRAAQTAEFNLATDGHSDAAFTILHVEALDPTGHAVPYYSRNVLATAGAASYSLPLAVSDMVGSWMVVVRDLLSGATVSTPLHVEN